MKDMIKAAMRDPNYMEVRHESHIWSFNQQELEFVSFVYIKKFNILLIIFLFLHRLLQG